MTTFSTKAQQKAQQFIYESGRPLEQARYAHHFENGSVQAVYDALTRFQNPDGGFGHSLESDIRLPDSSVIATTMGLQVLREVNAPVSHPLVQGAMRYLTDTYNPEIKAWEIIPANIDDAPHAPWWHYDTDLPSRWGGFLFNPRAEIIGYLWDYPELVPAGVPETLTADVMHLLRECPGAVGDMDMLCGIRLAETKHLPKAHRDQLIALLKPQANRLVERDPSKWTGYTLRPLEIAPTPQAVFAALLADDIQINLDFLIDTQLDDGAWQPTWTWGDLYPEAWPQACAEWKGVLTLHALHSLHAFGRFA